MRRSSRGECRFQVVAALGVREDGDRRVAQGPRTHPPALLRQRRTVFDGRHDAVDEPRVRPWRATQSGLGHLPRYQGETDLHDMAFIASCSAAIIANSSFAWWGAFLGDLQVCHYMVLDLSLTLQDTFLVAPTWTRHHP